MFQPELDIYGVWPAAIRAAGRLGIGGYLLRFLTGRRGVVSRAWHAGDRVGLLRPGELSDAAIAETTGHLLVLIGYAGDDVFVNDPAAPRASEVTVPLSARRAPPGLAHALGHRLCAVRRDRATAGRRARALSGPTFWVRYNATSMRNKLTYGVLLVALATSACGADNREWMKLDSTYTTAEFRRDFQECTVKGKLDDDCMKLARLGRRDFRPRASKRRKIRFDAGRPQPRR
jgi:hypothetical protein